MAKQKVETKFAQESKASVPVTNTMLAMFATSNESLTKIIGKAQRRNLPRLMLPKDIPQGAIIDGRIVDVVASPASQVKAACLWLEKNGVEFLFPVTSTVRQALAPGCKKADEESDAAYLKRLFPLLEKEKGNHLIAKKQAPAFNKQYSKEMHQFEVWTMSEAEFQTL